MIQCKAGCKMTETAKKWEVNRALMSSNGVYFCIGIVFLFLFHHDLKRLFLAVFLYNFNLRFSVYGLLWILILCFSLWEIFILSLAFFCYFSYLCHAVI